MARNKSKKKAAPQQQKKLSPERYMREKARSLPMGKCYITSDWKEAGVCEVVVSRQRPDGNVAWAVFYVDTFCMGVKDAVVKTDMSPDTFESYLDRMGDGSELVEIDYVEAHNIIYGAIAFAEEGGIEPAKDFELAQYILEEDTDDVPLIEYEFGKDGQHFLVVSRPGDKKHISTLKKKLGSNFQVIIEEDDDYDDDYDDEDEKPSFTPEMLRNVMENIDKMQAESNRHPIEEYSYDYPEYPATPVVKNQFIADVMLNPDYLEKLPREFVKQVMALPHDEAAADIAAVMMYEIGRTYRAINDATIGKPENSALLHGIRLLTDLESEKGLDAILELTRQNEAFFDYQIGDMLMEGMYYAIYACGRNNVARLEELLNTPGLCTFARAQLPRVLCMIAYNTPERRGEIIEVFRRLLAGMVDRLPRQQACDGAFAGFLMCELISIKATELLPEIEAVFATDCVDKTVCGNRDSVVRDLMDRDTPIDPRKLVLPKIFDQP